jgi:hypothetical protein
MWYIIWSSPSARVRYGWRGSIMLESNAPRLSNSLEVLSAMIRDCSKLEKERRRLLVWPSCAAEIAALATMSISDSIVEQSSYRDSCSRRSCVFES